MGIPYYFYTLTKSYGNIITNVLPINPDIYCMDFNGVIHPICAKLATNDEEKIIKELYIKVEQDIMLLKPKKTMICIDGIVPVAKMIQQRKRRYLTVYRNKIDNIKPIWDTNAITPATNFMNKLDTYFKKQIRYNTTDSEIIFSGSNEYGEGEHKIFKKLCAEKQDINIIINGLDADLIILCLLSHRKNIFLMRQQDNKDDMFVNINNLRDAIIKELTKRWQIPTIDDNYSNDAKNVIESYCVMCSLLGNDFIPHILTLNLKTDGLDRLISLTGNSYNTIGLLVQDSTINYMVLSDILQQLAKTEDKDIYKETERYIKNRYHNTQTGLKSDYYAIKNKDPIASDIYSDIEKWRNVYYKKIFNTNIAIDSSVINSACNQYIIGIYWTYAYYKDKPYDNTWYYPYTYPPTIKDISNYTLGNPEPVLKNKQVPLVPIIQLMIVLPFESKHLIDTRYQKYMEDTKYGLYHLYPKSYNIHTYMKTHLWECAPCLPNINIDYIKNNIL